MNLIEQYQQLPEAHAIPDAVWTVHKILTRIDHLHDELAEEKAELERSTPEMMRVLREEWSDDELRTVGLLT